MDGVKYHPHCCPTNTDTFILRLFYLSIIKSTYYLKQLRYTLPLHYQEIPRGKQHPQTKCALAAILSIWTSLWKTMNFTTSCKQCRLVKFSLCDRLCVGVAPAKYVPGETFCSWNYNRSIFEYFVRCVYMSVCVSVCLFVCGQILLMW